MLQYRRQAAQSMEATVLLGRGPLNYSQGGQASNQTPGGGNYNNAGVGNFPMGPYQRAQQQLPAVSSVPGFVNLPSCPPGAGNATQDTLVMQQIDAKFDKLSQQMSTLAELMARQVNSPRNFSGRIVNRSVDANGEQICFGCGQSGHINRMCPNRSGGRNRRQDARAVVQPPVQNDVRQYVPHRPQRANFNAYTGGNQEGFEGGTQHNLSLN